MPRKAASPSARLLERLRSRRFKECEVSWCREPAHGLSRYCSAHRTKKRATGDPQGKTLLRSHIRRHAFKAKEYILRHRGHDAIEAGLAWADGWLRWGRHFGNDWRNLNPTQQARQYLYRLREVETHEADVLSTIAAIQYVRRFEPGYLRSDDHFRFQTVLHILGLVPWPSEGNDGLVRKRYFRPTPRATEVLWNTIPSAILVLSHSIATKIEEEETGPLVDMSALLKPLPTTPRPEET